MRAEGVQPWRRRALVLAAAIFAVEVLIATQLAHWRWVRGSLGDYLVVFLLYLPVVAWRPYPPARVAGAVFVFAVLVECAQALRLAETLGLTPGGVGHTVVGATFSWGDVFMYALGCLSCVFVDRRYLRPVYPAPMRILHTMLRVGDLDRSLAFYTEVLGMQLLRRKDYPEGRFTLAFVGYGPESEGAAIELTHNWDTAAYEIGNGFGHVALAVPDAYAACDEIRRRGGTVTREAGPMKHGTTVIAFVQDPDGYKIELIQEGSRGA